MTLATTSIMDLNHIQLVGRVGADPEVRYFESGATKCALTLAVDKRQRHSEKPDWFNLEMWSKTAEVAASYVRKGKLIGVSGSLEIQRWQNPEDGSERSKPIIRVNRLELLSPKQDDNDSSSTDSDNNSDLDDDCPI